MQLAQRRQRLLSSARRYGDLSYLALGFPLGLIIWFGWGADSRINDFAANTPWLATALNIIFEQLPLPSDIEFNLSLVELLGLTYLVAAVKPTWRRGSGELFADTAAWVLHRLIEFAEWCLRNRWWSIALLLLLSWTLATNVSRHFDAMSKRAAIETSFHRWLDSVEYAISSTKLDGAEFSQFEAVIQSWNGRFASALSPKDYARAERLFRMIKIVFQDYDPQNSLLGHLGEKEKDLGSLYEEASAAPVEIQNGNRILDLMRMLRAIVLIRLGGDNCEGTEYILEAHRLLELVSSCCERSVANWKGNVYNCVHDQLVEDLVRNVPSVQRAYQSICRSYLECLSKAMHEYNLAARDAERCTFRARRRLNNNLDMKIKLALRYDVVALDAQDRQAPPWLASRDLLAEGIERNARELVRCNEGATITPLAFVTAAQGFAVASSLRAAGSEEKLRNLRDAGLFLRLSHSFKPRDLDNWDLRPFCSTLVGGFLDAAFQSGFEISTSLAPADSRLLARSIASQCH